MATNAPDHSFESERFREIADALPIGLWRIDGNFEQDWANSYWFEITGGRFEEEVNFGWVKRVHPDDRERVIEEFDRAFDAREPARVEYRLQLKDGGYRWFLDSGAPYYRNGEFAGFVGSCFDITERKQAETHLELLQTELVERSGTDTASILGAAVVHEVSQPLLAIGACAEGLERLIAGRGELPAEFGEAAAAIRQAADRARAIVRNCRDLAARRTVDRRQEDLSSVLRGVEPLIRLHPAATGTELRWDLGPDLQAWICATQIQQVLLNLAVNGLQAMQDASDPVLSISTSRWGKAAVVSVGDRGPGVPQGSREQLFEPSMSAKTDGMGLGLYLSRLIVGAHGGRIWVEDNPAGGSIFRFTVPASAPEGI